MSKQLYTRWGRELDPQQVLTEYPRPAMQRENYMILNGCWDYRIDDQEEPPEAYDGKILVPFSPEASLSGVGRILQPGEVLHYRRPVDAGQILPEGELSGKRLLLHFGAVDQRCRVYWNGREAGSHEGGYNSFTLDVTKFWKSGENILDVSVRDDTDTSYHTAGKQKLQHGGMWYTPQSGIWQTVWMEAVPECYIQELQIFPEPDKGQLRILVHRNQKDETVSHCSAVIRKRTEEGKTKALKSVSFRPDQMTRIRMSEFEWWSPEDPVLYNIEIEMGEDRIVSYFAMRSVAAGKDENGISRFLLNGKPYFQNGLLDQGYWPDGLYTPPSDEALIYDIEQMKALGFNMLRKHMKVECARWYYHCDRLGMLVWQDMPCGGESYDMNYVCNLPNLFPVMQRSVRDAGNKKLGRLDPLSREEYTKELETMIRQLSCYPSIAAWVPFNEGWGQFEAAKASELVRRLDPSRLIDEASGWFDQGGGDVYSIHNYWYPLNVHPDRKKGRVLCLTEYGGFSCRLEGHSYAEKVYGYRKYKNSRTLTAAMESLWRKSLIPAVRKGLGGAVYTQLSDVEEEVNGILTWDRELVKVDEERIRQLNKELAEEFSRNAGTEKE